MAQAAGKPVEEVVSGGIGLAFIAFPKLISSLGAGADFFGILFFTSLFVAGITSMVSILEVPIAALQDKLQWSRVKAVSVIGGGTGVVSIFLFSTTNAIKLVDIIDHFINNLGIVSGALLSIVMVSWFKRNLMTELEMHINHISTIKLGRTWEFTLTIVTPVVLLSTLLLVLNALIQKGYGDYSDSLVMYFGWGSIIFCALGALVMSKIHDR